MKKVIFFLIILLSTSFCFGQQWKTLYDFKGVSLSYKYEKIGTDTDSDCSNFIWDVYQITAKVKNINNKAISSVMGSLDFNGELCTPGGRLESTARYSIGDIFMPHGQYSGVNSYNSNYGTVIQLLLYANDEYVTTIPYKIKVRQKEPFPKPEWHFPDWKFVEKPEGVKAVGNGTNNDAVEAELIEKPEFPGGSGAFAQMVTDGFNWNNIKGEGKIKVFIKFTVLKDGRIADIEVSGENTSLNDEALKSAKSITTLWKPGRTKNGNVNCSHTLPISVSF